MATPKRHYFLDFALAENGNHYLRLTRSELKEDSSYARSSLIVFEDNFSQFITAFSSLFQSAAYQGRGYQSLKEIAQESKAQAGIKAMPDDQRPRERMFNNGSEALSDCELLAILLGAGSPGETAIDLAAKILSEHGGTLSGLLNSSFPSLCRFRGMGLAKGSSIIAAIELARRLFGIRDKIFN